MNLLLTLLRFGFLLLLWLFILGVVMVIRRDAYGTEVRDRGSRGRGKRRRSRAAEEAPAAASAPGPEPLPFTGSQGDIAGSPSARPEPRLAVTAGPLTGTVLPLGNNPLTIGRAPDSALVIDDSFASSRHARVYFEGGYWWIEDTGSTNGTFVDGTRITRPEALLPGRSVTVGKTTMELQV